MKSRIKFYKPLQNKENNNIHHNNQSHGKPSIPTYFSPVKPALQMHDPFTASHAAAFLQSHLLVQLSPNVPSGHGSSHPSPSHPETCYKIYCTFHTFNHSTFHLFTVSVLLNPNNSYPCLPFLNTFSSFLQQFTTPPTHTHPLLNKFL